MGQVRGKAESEVRNVAVEYTGKLDSGELLTGSPTVAEVGSSDLTIANVAVSSATLTINGVSALAGQAVTFNVTGGAAGRQYKIQITAATDSTPAQTLIDVALLNCYEDDE
jgi:hypothetical protein